MEVEVTHPFHPWRGRRLVLATRKRNWGEDRVMFFDDAGRVRSIPASWTDVDEPDAFIRAAGGRSFLRAAELAALVGLIDEIEQRLRHDEAVRTIAPQV